MEGKYSREVPGSRGSILIARKKTTRPVCAEKSEYRDRLAVPPRNDIHTRLEVTAVLLSLAAPDKSRQMHVLRFIGNDGSAGVFPKLFFPHRKQHGPRMDYIFRSRSGTALTSIPFPKPVAITVTFTASPSSSSMTAPKYHVGVFMCLVLD